MNYIKEMNAFYDYMEFNPLSSSAVALWFALMHINNKARWKEKFSVASTVLRFKSGLKETSFKRARQELVDKGYIIYQSRKRNLAPIYQIVSLTEKWEAEKDQIVEYLDTEEMVDCKPTALTVDEKKKGKSPCVTFYKENFGGELSTYMENSIVAWCEKFGEELTLEAMKRAVERNKVSWGYVKGILLDWQKKGIHTLEQTKEEQAAFQKEREKEPRHSFVTKGPIRHKDDIIPDWFNELKEKERIKKQHMNEKLTPEEIETQRVEIARLKKKILGAGKPV